jgi:hypothetical protein
MNIGWRAVAAIDRWQRIRAWMLVFSSALVMSPSRRSA